MINKFSLSFLLLISLFLLKANNIYGSSSDSLELVLQETHDVKKKIELYTILSKSYSNNDIKKAKENIHKALNLSKSTGVEDFLAENYAILGDLAVIEDSLDVALNFYKLSLSLLELKPDIEKLFGVTLVLGNIENVKNNNAEAMLYYERAAKYAKEAGLDRALDNIYLNIAILNINAGSFIEAQGYLSQALEIANKFNDSLDIANVYSNLGIVYINFDDTITASKYLHSSLKIYQRLGTSSNMAYCYHDLSILEKSKKNYLQAIKYLEMALDFGLKEDPSYVGPKNIILSGIYDELGQNYFFLNELRKSKTNYEKALSLGTKTGELSVITDAYKGISEILYKNGEIDSAYHFLKLYKESSDSLLNSNNIKKLAIQDAKFKYEQLLSEENQKRIEESGRQQRNFIIMILVIIGLVLAIVILFLYIKLGRNKFEKSRLIQESLEKELELRNKELATQVLYQLKNNEFILNISDKLNTLLSKLQPENKKIIEEVIHEIARDSGGEIWKEFEVRFQQVHTGFYKNLSNKFPDLTPNELKLSAFLKLNMSTKDIAAITYQTTNSIDVGRSRLRQKLGLNKDESLSTFLSRF